ncbi:uncharacterized protein LOC119642271 [Glossina fuscipes]|uniref:Uncharacterized protein LOC119642271 n=1 Tax=Glossina fuscipes TaxID=7396 RepID=A0A9C5ZCZ3_9MUSC|nr:uncharacterized protein LOC119642271 [Glossina fuscipes]
MSKFPVNKQITQGNQTDNISGYSKSLVLRETNVALGLQKASGERPELGVGKNAVGLNDIFIENEWKEVKSKVSRDEVGKMNNPGNSLISASFQTANGKKISISKESQISVKNILREFQDNFQETNDETELKDIKARMSIKSMESKFGKNTNSSAQIANKTGFQATFKIHQDNVGKFNNPGSSLISESFQTANVKKKPIFEKEKSNESGLEDIKDRKKHLLSLNPKFNYRPPQLCETPRQSETPTPELGEFVKNAVETSPPGINRKLPVQEKDNDAILMANRPKRWRLSGLSRTRTNSKK